jgi:hypothetical protein
LIDPQLLRSMERVADPLADRTVTALVSNGTPLDTSGLTQATRLMAGWTSNGALAHWQPSEPNASPDVVQALQDYLSQAAALPDWTDPDKVARAEKIFMDHGPLSCTLLFCTSLPECYALPRLAEVLQIAGQLEVHTEHRIRQTAAMVFPVMMRGGLLSADGAGVAQVLKVRLIHASIRHLILRGDPALASGVVASNRSASPPASLHDALMEHGWNVQADGLPCNQIELAYTLLTFSYSFLAGMRKLGQGLSKPDEEAYLHAWNVMGHVLGIRHELMAQTMDEAQAMFRQLQDHAQTQRASPDPRPALGRALINTMARSIRIPVIKHIPVPLTQWLIGAQTARQIGVDQQVSWLTQGVFWLGLGLTRIVDAVARLVIPGFSLSRLLTRIVGYHLLTRFLLDQTRPLNLPDHLLDPLTQTVAAWGDDARAAGWVNRLEDRFTATGIWRAQQSRKGRPS